MADLFISYAREDRETAHALADALQRHGLTAWWDRALTGGGDFAHEIEQHLRAAPVAVVLWSADSVRSDFVRDESSRARDMHKLLPVRIAPVGLPLGFGTLHTLDLIDWDGDPDDPGCLALVDQVRQRLAQARAAPVSPPPAPVESSSFGQRRRRRRLLLGAGAAGGVALLGLGALSWRHYLQREALGHLGRGLAEHFADPPRLERAQSEYASALGLDAGLAPAHYFLAHLYAQLMLRGSPPPSGELLDALRADARAHFQQALAHAERLDGAQRVIARGQLALLSQEDAAPALSRPAPAEDDPGPPPPPAPTSSGPSTVATGPSAPVTTGSPRPARPVSGEAVAALQRVQAPAAVAQAARGRSEALFGTDRDSRLSASTSLTLDPAAAAESLPSAIALARRALRATPQADASPAADALRQGLTNTLALAERASPSTLRAQSASLRALLAELAASPFGPSQGAAAARLETALERSAERRPVAYLQIANEAQRPIAQALARKLEAAGYLTPGIELTGPARAPARPGVRVQGTSDPDLARWCQRALAEATQAPAELVVLRRAQPRTDTFELWFDKALCAPGGRQLSACA